MFCSNCGEKLVDANQNYCHKCGNEIFITSKTLDYRIERTQVVSPPKTYPVPVYQQKQRERGPPGKYSKLCLGLALASIFIGIISLIIGYNFSRLTYWMYYNYGARLLISIGILLLRVVGLILGVFSKVNGSKAELYEPYNDTEKAGSIFGVFGIIINAIGLFLSLFGPWSILTFPY
ncbi:MAG: zinc ribbon domain-containing protein [Promethearchaeota archaeon]